jgi:poly-gamma-glutamate capsule biosynthesis protein CapA/YwtB (metallophosphatase superfamily)
MDGTQRDHLTKALARGVPRRTVLKGLGGSVLGTALGRAGWRRAPLAAAAASQPVQRDHPSGPGRFATLSGTGAAQPLRLVFLGQYLKRFPTAPSNVRKTQLLGAYLQSLNADYVFSDTEEAILTPGAAVNNSTPSLGPDLVFDIMRDVYGISLVAVSNNHIFDQGASGFLNTLQQLRDRGIPFAGGGSNLDEASTPLVLPLRAPNRTLALHAVVSAPTLNQFGGIATADSPGVNAMQVDSMDHPQLIDPVAEQLQYARIQQAAQLADIVLTYHHDHYNDRTNAYSWLPWEQRYSQNTIDNGASIYLHHGIPNMLGIETYRGHYIFHNLGSLVYQTTNIGPPAPYSDNFESFIAVMDVDAETTQVTAITLLPVALNPTGEGAFGSDEYLESLGEPGYVPKENEPAALFAPPSQGLAILYRLAGMSAELGTQIVIDQTTVTGHVVLP